jgi:flagellum-specific ATP synthase
MEADDPHEPIADAVRSLSDGHIQLSRRLAEQGFFPAIDVLASVSRLRNQVTSEEHQKCVSELTRIMAAYRDAEDLIQIGAYVKGRNSDVDRALDLMPRIREYLCQGRTEDVTLTHSIQALDNLLLAD